MKLNRLAYENVRTITSLPVKTRLSAIAVTGIFQSFTYKMAAKISWHRYGTKLRHGHPMYRCQNPKIRNIF